MYNLSQQRCRFTNLCCRTTAEFVVALQYVDENATGTKTDVLDAPLTLKKQINT